MKVLTIVGYDDCNTGEVSAVIEMPEGADEDDVFVAWLRKTSSYYKTKPRKECLEAMYAWNVVTVQKCPPLGD